MVWEMAKIGNIKEAFRSRSSKVGLLIIIFIVLMAILAPYIAPYDPYEYVGDPYEPPSSEHLLGTDDMGHDLLSQIIYGAQVSLLVGVLSALGCVLIGTIIGVISGFLGGWIDEILMRLTDVVLVIPYLVFIILLVSYLGPSIWNIVISISILGWPSIARMVRSYVLSLRENLYIEAARAIGCGNRHIMIKYIIPGLVPLIVPIFVLTIIDGILTEAGLSFLGLGDPNKISWGIILYYAQVRGAFVKGLWWWILPPGLLITVTGLGFLLLGSSLEEYFNPRFKRR
mgnify:CR=1 FL=1